MRILLHLADGSYEAVELDEIFFFTAHGDETLVRLRGSRSRRDVRRLADLEWGLPAGTFFRIHRSHLVSLAKIRFLRRRDRGRDWEVKLEPPVNRVLPVSRGALAGLVEALEG
jgi:DNA-binding LytR/AlgR family response regulator